MTESAPQTALTAEQQGELEVRLVRASEDNHIPCARALVIAKSLGIPANVIGKTANKLKIKISNCQLGCF